MLTNNKRTHYILLWDWTKINITKAQYDLYREEVWMKKHNEFITINDIDTNEIIFEWRCSEIKRFSERITDNSHTYNAVCSFWWRHNIALFPENCQCSKEFNCLWIVFKDKLEAIWFKVFYDTEITEDMRTAYKKHYMN